jgi:N-acetylmuramic acid 6-phosphate etherase
MTEIDYRSLPTEMQNPLSASLDTLSIAEIVHLMNKEDAKIPLAVKREARNIVRAVKLLVKSLQSGHRVFFVGAGTSGRLGVLESAELPPTFNTPPRMAEALIAGGKGAVFRSQEGAEDRLSGAKTAVRKKTGKGDVVIGIAASGVTSFVRGALEQAKKMKARTILLTCNMVNPVRENADVVIAPSVGPEVLAGSTRLKSATATKMILNMLTTAAMVRLGKVYGNRMVDLQPRSRKLRERGIRLLQDIVRLPRSEAEDYFRKARGNVKTAIVMAKRGLDYSRARKLLKRHRGFLRPALQQS